MLAASGDQSALVAMITTTGVVLAALGPMYVSRFRATKRAVRIEAKLGNGDKTIAELGADANRQLTDVALAVVRLDDRVATMNMANTSQHAANAKALDRLDAKVDAVSEDVRDFRRQWHEHLSASEERDERLDRLEQREPT